MADTRAVVILTTRRLVLRPFEDGDSSAVLTYRNDPAVARLQGWPQPFTEAHFRKLLDRERRFAETGWVSWCVADTNGVIGDIGLRPHDDHAEIGISLAAGAQGQGYASEALAELSRYAFIDLGVQRLHAGVNPGNSSVIRLLVGAGWQHEATEPQSYWHRDHCDDEASYALTRHEWQRHASRPSIVAGTDAPGTE
jgi:RimJ/RimL family protein N-acetyltransferase